MFGFQSIAFNISAGHLQLLSRLGLLVDRARERTVATDMIKRLAVRTPHERQPISAMSGGNAQKVVLARQLVERPEVLVLAEPTQGVDVGAKEEIHRIITELADGGTAVLVVTSDLPEALRIADRLQRGARRHHDRRVRPGRHPGRRARRRRRAPSTRRRWSHDRHDDPPRAQRRAAGAGARPQSHPALADHRAGAGADRRDRRDLGRCSRSATPAFLTAGSIQPLLVATAPIALIGVGMTIIIITGGIDVSVGAAIMVCSVLTAKALVGGMSRAAGRAACRWSSAGCSAR